MREAVITQFAPVNAGVIECMQKCTTIVRYGIGVDLILDLTAGSGARWPCGSSRGSFDRACSLKEA